MTSQTWTPEYVWSTVCGTGCTPSCAVSKVSPRARITWRAHLISHASYRAYHKQSSVRAARTERSTYLIEYLKSSLQQLFHLLARLPAGCNLFSLLHQLCYYTLPAQHSTHRNSEGCDYSLTAEESRAEQRRGGKYNDASDCHNSMIGGSM